MDDEDYVNVEKITIIERGKLLAIATVSFLLPRFDCIFVNFFIWESKENNKRLHDNVYISPPTLKGYKSKLVWIQPEGSWQILEARIYDAYVSTPRRARIKEEESTKEEETNNTRINQ